MKIYELRNASTDLQLAKRVGRASNSWERGIGLLMRSHLAPDEGLWIDHCSAIHTMMMRVGIDVFFLDRNGRVLSIANAVSPNRLFLACANAVAVVELGVGGHAVSVGDRLILE